MKCTITIENITSSQIRTIGEALENVPGFDSGTEAVVVNEAPRPTPDEVGDLVKRDVDIVTGSGALTYGTLPNTTGTVTGTGASATVGTITVKKQDPFEALMAEKDAEIALNLEKAATHDATNAFNDAIDSVPAGCTTFEKPSEGATLDSKGVPWDTRIHGSGKTFMKSGPRVGQWKLARGINPELVATVENELLHVVATPGAVNYSELYGRLVEGFTTQKIGIFDMSAALQKLGLGAISEASGNNEAIQALADELL